MFFTVGDYITFIYLHVVENWGSLTVDAYVHVPTYMDECLFLLPSGPYWASLLCTPWGMFLCLSQPSPSWGESTCETLHMWKSRVEIEDYSVAYFHRIAAFKVPYRWTSVKRGAHKRFVDLLDISCIYGARMSPTLNGSSAIKRFKHSDVIKICDGITFDFYTGLPHM